MSTDVFLILVAFLLAISPIFLMKKMTAALEHLMQWLSSFTKQDFRSYCSLEVPIDEVTIARKDGGLVTFIKLRGTISVVGVEEFEKICLRLDNMFSAQMRDSGHDIQIVFHQDVEDSGKLIEDAYAPVRETCRRIGLEIEDLLDSDVEALSRIVANESCLAVLSTHPVRLAAEAVKDDIHATQDHIKEHELPKLAVSQNPARMLKSLMTAHEGFVAAIKSIFDESGILSSIMPVHEALAFVRREIDPDTHPDWRPSLPGDRIPADLRRGIQSDDWSDLFYPPLFSQLAKKDAEVIGGADEVIKIGEVYYGTVGMDIPPQKPEAFSVLLARLRKAQIPFRISFRIYSNGIDMVKFNKTMVGFLSMFPKSHNARIKGAMDFLETLTKDANDPTMGVGFALTTWARDQKKLARNLQNASRILQGWGSCDVSSSSGDAMDMFTSALPGLSTSCASRVMMFPASELSGMMPIERPSSVWEKGAVMLASIDGKLMPFQPGSKEQTTWVSLIFAPPGKGKSVLLNSLELACCIAPGLMRLPLMTVIDIGESVSGLISLLQSALPDHRKHEAGYFKLQMKPEYSVNILDTQLGFRYPTPNERDFAVAFLSMLATPAGRQRPYDSTYEMLGLVVDELYRRFSDTEAPKRYEAGMDDLVDSAIADCNIILDGESSWWEVVDMLFERGRVSEAARAQRFAVPIISDVPAILNSPQVFDIYGKIEVGETKELLPEIVSRMVSSALREYKIFGSPTQWDLSNCRVAGFDLNDVRGKGESGKKQTALMYAFAQNVASKNYYINDEMLRDIPDKAPEMYRIYHQARVDDVAEEIKTISYDEFHNTGGLEGVRRIVGVNIREGRKWNIQVLLASQLLDDFDSDMVENATSIYILGAENNVTLDKCRSTFGLTDSMMHALERHVVSRGTFLSVQLTTSGKSVHALRNILSPVKYWAFTTTAEEKQVRRKLYERIPPAAARRLLADRFPPGAGGFKAYFETRRMAMRGDGADEDENIVQVIVNELCAEWEKRQE